MVATSTLADPTGTVSRRTAVLFRKSKTASSPHKPPKATVVEEEEVEKGKEPKAEKEERLKEEEEEGEEDEAQLGSKSFLSVVIPRLETLLHGKKRKHSCGRDSEEDGAEHEEAGESPVKQLDTGAEHTHSYTLHSSQLVLLKSAFWGQIYVHTAGHRAQFRFYFFTPV